MNFRDRTDEFRSRVEKFQKAIEVQPAAINGAAHALTGPVQVHLHSKSKFNAAARHINDAIIVVTERLEKLTALARQRVLFNDPAQEIHKLTYSIKQDLIGINKDIATLEEFSAQNNVGKSGQSSLTSKEILSDLKNKLAHTSKNFTDVLQMRTKNLKEQSTRRGEYESAQQSANVRKRTVHEFGQLRQQLLDADADEDELEAGGATTDGESSTMLLRKGRAAAGPGASAGVVAGAPFAYGAAAGGVPGVAEAPQLPQFDALLQDEDTAFSNRQAQMLVASEQGDEYMASRALAVDGIRSTIEEVAVLYKRLNQLVLEQEEMTVRIDANVEDTLVNVEDGHNELLKYMDGLSSNQWLIMKIFGFLIVFAIFFVTFIA